jgi:hypothetical protein
MAFNCASATSGWASVSSNPMRSPIASCRRSRADATTVSLFVRGAPITITPCLPVGGRQSRTSSNVGASREPWASSRSHAHHSAAVVTMSSSAPKMPFSRGAENDVHSAMKGGPSTELSPMVTAGKLSTEESSLNRRPSRTIAGLPARSRDGSGFQSRMNRTRLCPASGATPPFPGTGSSPIGTKLR